MDYAARRSALTVAALATAGALALTPVTIAPHEIPGPVRISAQTVHLTDAWSDLFADTGQSLIGLAALALGANPSYPLPSPTIPLAPVATQLVLNQLIYVAKLFNGQAGEVPGWIGAHLNEVGKVVQLIFAATPGVVVEQIRVPFAAAQEALNSIGSSGNLLTGLFEAPAVFLDYALNNQYGLLNLTGPIGLPLIFRNLLAAALYTPPPAIVLPFKKPAGAALTPKSSAVEKVSPKVSAPSGTASSARSKPKAPANSSRKATAAKAGTGSGGQARSKRG